MRQSTKPRLVRRNSGKQASGMSAMVINGDGKVQPIISQDSSSLATVAAISSAGSSFMRPAIGSGTQPNTLPSYTATIPPPHSIKVLAASAISSSLVPTTRRLWASWATVLAMAPFLMPKPLTNPAPMVPVS